MSDEASRAQAAEAARTNYQAQRDAMVAGDADALGALLADGFTLTHMTRYLQPKVEWLADVRSGEMTYDAIQDVDVTVDVDADTPVLTARTHTDGQPPSRPRATHTPSKTQ
jgi:hypothetical protein